METNQKPSELDVIQSALFGTIDSEGKRLKVCLLSTFLLGLIAHGFGLLNLLIGHDSLHEFYWAASRDWKFTLGRFMEPILRFVMGELISLPWLAGLCGILFVALAVHLLSKMFSLNTVWENILLSGICITNMTVTALIATYIHDFAGDILALLLAVCTAYCWYNMREGFSWKYSFWGAVSLAASFGFYQAYLAVLLTVMCIFAIVRLLRGDSAKNVIAHLLRSVPMLVLAVAGYFAGVKVTQRLFQVSASTGDGGNDLTMIGSHLRQLGELTVRGYKQVWIELFTTIDWEWIKGVHKVTNQFISLVNILLGLYALWAMARTIRKNKVRALETALILALLLLLPLAISSVSIISTTFHGLVRYAVFLFYLLVLAVSRTGDRSETAEGWRRGLLCGLVALVIFSNVQLSNMSYEKKELEQQATLSTMTRVLARLEDYEDYVEGESQVAIIGNVAKQPLDLDILRGAVGLYHTSPIATPQNMEDYFEIVLQYPLDFCPVEKQYSIRQSEAFQAMGTFPAKDSIATIDGVIVVKMS